MLQWVFSILTVPLPCIVSDWGEWIGPDSTGTEYRYRYVVRPPLNINGECPPLLQSRKGTNKIYIARPWIREHQRFEDKILWYFFLPCWMIKEKTRIIRSLWSVLRKTLIRLLFQYFIFSKVLIQYIFFFSINLCNA